MAGAHPVAHHVCGGARNCQPERAGHVLVDRAVQPALPVQARRSNPLPLQNMEVAQLLTAHAMVVDVHNPFWAPRHPCCVCMLHAEGVLAWLMPVLVLVQDVPPRAGCAGGGDIAVCGRGVARR